MQGDDVALGVLEEAHVADLRRDQRLGHHHLAAGADDAAERLVQVVATVEVSSFENGVVRVGNLQYYDADRVTPPEGVSSLDWIKSGFKRTK